MFGESKIREIANAVLARSRADQTEVVILSIDSALTRFADSAIHQNVAEANAEVRIRVVVGSRIGIATTNSLEEEAWVQALDSAVDMALLQPENPDFKSLPVPQPVIQVSAFSEATAGCRPESRARGVGAICLMAREAGVVASGALSTEIFEIAVANSLGVFAYHPMTQAEINTVIMSDTSAGYAAALSLDVADLDFEAIGREALDRCLRSQSPRSVDPGEYAVILEPYAVQDFVQMMAFTGFGAVPWQEGRSFMTGKIGQRIVDSSVSIWDDGLDPKGIPLPFDFEGVPKQRVDLVEEGVARGVVYDSYRAGKEEGKTSTGHALLAPSASGPLPLNLFFGPGGATLEEMIASTERGLYVTRFHYTRPVEPTTLVVTGMTRDGTFLIEDGEISYPIKNLRFTQGYLDALNHVEMVGSEARLLLSMGIARHSVPALKLGKFNFTGATEF